MWRSKGGDYKYFNIDMFYDRKKQNVGTLFPHVDGDLEVDN